MVFGGSSTEAKRIVEGTIRGRREVWSHNTVTSCKVHTGFYCRYIRKICEAIILKNVLELCNVKSVSV